jgi:succinate-semialdehyde dehydrogenase / glutarate-semialdehyde dehydrogenase
MPIKSVNPKNGQVIKEYKEMSDEEVFGYIGEAYECYKRWRNNGEEGLKERMETILDERRDAFCETITCEMGKPLKACMSEVDKAIKMIEYYVENASEFLSNENLKTKFPETFV